MRRSWEDCTAFSSRVTFFFRSVRTGERGKEREGEVCEWAQLGLPSVIQKARKRRSLCTKVGVSRCGGGVGEGREGKGGEGGKGADTLPFRGIPQRNKECIHNLETHTSNHITKWTYHPAWACRSWAQRRARPCPSCRRRPCFLLPGAVDLFVSGERSRWMRRGRQHMQSSVSLQLEAMASLIWWRCGWHACMRALLGAPHRRNSSRGEAG